MRLKKCSGCARAILESATVCDYCGHQAADPIAPAPGVDTYHKELESLFDFPPDDSTPQARPPASQPDPTAAEASRDDSQTVQLPEFTGNEQLEDLPEPASQSLRPSIEHPSEVHAEDATRWFDSLTDDVERANASEESAPPEVAEFAEPDHLTAAMPEPAAIAASQAVPTARTRSGLGRKEVMVGLGVAVVGGVLIVALMSARGVAAPAASDAPASNPTKATRPASSQPASAMAPKAASAAAPAPQWSSNSVAWLGRERGGAAFELAANNKVAVWMRHVQPMLVVRCHAKQKVEVFVFTASAAKMEPQDENHTVRVQFDGQPVSTERWADSSEHDALFAPDGQAFLQQLLAAERLQFGFSPHNADPAVATFQVAGLAGHLGSAARQCGVRNH